MGRAIVARAGLAERRVPQPRLVLGARLGVQFIKHLIGRVLPLQLRDATLGIIEIAEDNRLSRTRLPEGLTWNLLIAGSCLGGIGFTMSLFIAGLGLPAELLVVGKTGVLLGSLIAGLLGAWLLSHRLPRPG